MCSFIAISLTAATVAATDVTAKEFRNVWIGEKQHRVEDTFGTDGRVTDEWIVIGVNHRVKHYHAETGVETWIRVEYWLTLAGHWRLVSKEWCVRADMQQGIVCYPHPYP